MTQSAIINPVTLPENLNAAEEYFVQRMTEGRRCIFGLQLPGRRAGKGENANVVRARVVDFFVRGGDEDHRVRGNIIHLSGVHISGFLNLEHVSTPYALTLSFCYFNDVVHMPFFACPALNMMGSYLSDGLHGDRIKIEHDLNVGFRAADEVRLLAAEVGGSFYCEGGVLENKKYALGADRIKVQGNVSLQEGFRAKGEVRFSGAHIGGSMYCPEVEIESETGTALNAEGIIVGGVFTMNNDCATKGEVCLVDATVGGTVYCDNGAFGNEEGVALNFKRAKIGGELSLDETLVEGDMHLIGADIGKDISFCQSHINGDVIAEHMKVKDSLLWLVIGGKGRVNLSFATVGTLTDQAPFWEDFTFELDGFSYERFFGSTDAQTRIKWLDSCPEEEEEEAEFSPQPFEQAAKVLFAMGHHKDAREVLLAKERRLTERGQMSGWRRFARECWDAFAGYGYRLRRTLAWSAGIILAGMVVFNFAANSCRIVPSDSVIMANKHYRDQQVHKCTEPRQPIRAVEKLFPEYPRFGAFMYSVDVFIPFFALHQEPYWQPQPEEKTAEVVLFILIAWFQFQIAAGWGLTSLLVLSVTGLLRPRQSSGKE